MRLHKDASVFIISVVLAYLYRNVIICLKTIFKYLLCEVGGWAGVVITVKHQTHLFEAIVQHSVSEGITFAKQYRTFFLSPGLSRGSMLINPLNLSYISHLLSAVVI